MEPSFKLMAQVGNKWLFIPVLHYTEFGNHTDGMIKWILKKDGTFVFDLSMLDKYISFAQKYWVKIPIICFVVNHGTSSHSKMRVTVHKEGGGTEEYDLGATNPNREKAWKAFSVTIYTYMQEKGLADSLNWGFGWDGIGDAAMIPMLEKFVPEVKRWASGCHAGNRLPRYANVFAFSSIYGIRIDENSRLGWKNPKYALTNPRAGSSVISANGHSPAFPYRLLPERALAVGYRGVGRMGADYWKEIFYSGVIGRAWAGAMPGIGCLSLYWPGKKGAEPSQRFYSLVEGVQEAEARIFIEQCVEWGHIKGDLAAKAKNILQKHYRETLYFPTGRIGIQITEYSGGWQKRSDRLYSLASEVAKAAAFNVDKTSITRSIPARGKVKETIVLRNWSPGKKKWKAEADQPWIMLQKTEGEISGNEDVSIIFDSSKLTPGSAAKGVITITETGSGKKFPVSVNAAVGQVLGLAMPKTFDMLGQPGHASSFGPKKISDFATFNVCGSKPHTRVFPLINHSLSDVTFKIESPVSWLKVAPNSGTVKVRERIDIKVTAAPTDTKSITHAVKVKLAETGGTPPKELLMKVHVIPPYKTPAGMPSGTAVPASTLNNKENVAAHKARAYWYGSSSKQRDDFGPKYNKDGNITGGHPQMTVYNIAGKGYKAFSATVGFAKQQRRKGGGKGLANFEIHVDGKVAVQSGFMKKGDAPKLLVVTGLENAKELTIMSRYDLPEAINLVNGGTITWEKPTFYK
jgi:hypothetical protein